MTLFKSNYDFIEYIYSLKWENKEPYFIEPWPIGRYSLSDLINHLETLSHNGLTGLVSDILIKAERERFEELKNYPQELFGNLYEEELQPDKLENWIEQNFPVANYILYQLKRLIRGYINHEQLSHLDNKPQKALNQSGDNYGNSNEESGKLGTPEAECYFRQLEALGFMKISGGVYEWRGTKKELALVAELMSERLGIAHKWKVFGQLFGIDNLAHAKHRAKEIDGMYSKREKEIKAIFGE